MAKVLLVDDDVPLSATIKSWLEGEHHTVEAVEDGQEGWDRLHIYSYDVAIIDWSLPGMTGPEISRRYRDTGGTVPILMLTGKGNIQDKETGFDSGADDYLTKPFEFRELSARIRALLKRPRVLLLDVLRAGNIELDPKTHKVKKAGVEIHLQRREFALLEFLMRNPNEPFSNEALLDRVWPSTSEASPDMVKACFAKLRRKIDTEGGPSLITTVHGVGYKLEVKD